MLKTFLVSLCVFVSPIVSADINCTAKRKMEPVMQPLQYEEKAFTFYNSTSGRVGRVEISDCTFHAQSINGDDIDMNVYRTKTGDGTRFHGNFDRRGSVVVSYFNPQLNQLACLLVCTNTELVPAE